MKRRRGAGRTPDDDELMLWRRVVSTTRPLDMRAEPDGGPAARAEDAVPTDTMPGSGGPGGPVAPRPAIAAFEIGARAPGRTATHQPATTKPPAPVPRYDARMARNLGRGKLVPEARIDLHGMTLAQAHPALVRFVLNAQAQGKRLVLVITGKGETAAQAAGVRSDAGRERGQLRRQVPMWLAAPPLSGVVLGLREAHLRHGGGGAIYVVLSRRR